ncbi:MAG: hypothetical protein GY719_41050 [bacterium]|nr:hypothetical protein [bacterium]
MKGTYNCRGGERVPVGAAGSAGVDQVTEERPDSELSRAIERGAGWLSEFLSRRLQRLDLTSGCLGLFGLACAVKSAPASLTTALEETLARMRQRLGEIVSQPEAARQFRHGAVLSPLMAAVACRTSAARSPELERFCTEEWAHVDLPKLRESAPVSHQAALCLFDLLSERWSANGDRPMWLRSIATRPSKYRLDDEAIEDLATEIHALSGYGTVVPRLPSEVRAYLEDALPFWTFFFAKERDLDTLCPLVRAMKYLGLDGAPEYSRAIQFIRNQQKPDHRFGSQDMELHLLSRASAEPIDSDREIHLPLTVSSVWTLSHHCSSDSRFFGA